MFSTLNAMNAWPELNTIRANKINNGRNEYIINRYGKGTPNMTFVIKKPQSLDEANDLIWQYKDNKKILFGEFWISRTNHSTFRPKKDGSFALIQYTNINKKDICMIKNKSDCQYCSYTKTNNDEYCCYVVIKIKNK